MNRELNLLSAALNWSRRELMIAVENPVAAVRRPKNPPPRTRRLDPDEERRLLEALEYGPRERKDGKRYCRGTRNPYISMTCATRPQAGSQSGCPM